MPRPSRPSDGLQVDSVRAQNPALVPDLKWDPLVICVAIYVLTSVGRVHQLEHELRRPLDVLAEQGVRHAPVLAYPNGDYNSTVAAAREAGYRAAVTTDSGLESSRPGDLFRLKRIGVHDDVSRSVPSLTFHIARQLWAA